MKAFGTVPGRKGWLSEALGVRQVAVGTKGRWSQTLSFLTQTEQSSQEGSKRGSHNPWDSGSQSVFPGQWQPHLGF